MDEEEEINIKEFISKSGNVEKYSTHDKNKNEYMRSSFNSTDLKIERTIAQLLIRLGYNLNDPNFCDTPHRMLNFYKEVLVGDSYTNAEIANMFGDRTFHVQNDNLVVKEIKDVYSLCSHHMVPMRGRVVIAYVPVAERDGEGNELGYRVLGLSKLPRIVDMCAKRLTLQEKLTDDIAECVKIATGSPDVYVFTDMEFHLCVEMRGIKSPGFTKCAGIYGRFRTVPDLRKEVEAYLN